MRNFNVGMKSRTNRGSALLMTVIYSTLLLMVATASCYTTMQQARFSGRSIAWQQALGLAEAGAESAMAELNRTDAKWVGWSASGGGYVLNSTVNDQKSSPIGTFAVTVTNAASANPIIVSKGIVPGSTGPTISRTIKVRAINNLTRSPFGEFPIFSMSTIMNNSNSLMDSYDSTLGPYNVNGNKGANAHIGAVSNITMNSNAKIYGNIQAGGTIVSNSNILITGQKLPQNAPTPPPAFPLQNFNAAKLNHDNDKIQIVDKKGVISYPKPATNGSILVDTNTTLVFPPGTYVLKGITANSGTEIKVDPAGQVKLYLDNPGAAALLLNSNTTLNANTQNPYNFQLFIKSGSFTMNSNVTLYAGIYAPDADIIFNSNGDFYGGLVAKSITWNSNINFHADTKLNQPAAGGASGGGGAYADWWIEKSPMS
jgi:hypothetical protein